MEYGRYQILNQLGQGGMATVYLAEDPLLQRLVAVKVIQAHLSTNSSLMDRFTVEAKTIAALRHVNIVEVFDFGVQDESQYLVMEYIDGHNLQAVCSAVGKPMSNTVTAAIICQAAEGLTSAEKHGVVHRDIKPENLMFNSEGVLKIADFGIAHIADEQSRTQTGAVLGSPNFMSPEQIEGAKPTHKTDLFSLGGVFYYCLTGKLPFTGVSIPATMRNICERPHPSILEANPEADPDLVKLVDTLLEKRPPDRGEGSRWLANQLRAYLNRHNVVDIVEHTRSFFGSINLSSRQPTPDGSGTTPSKSAIKSRTSSSGSMGGARTGATAAVSSRTGAASANTTPGGGAQSQVSQPTTSGLSGGRTGRNPLIWMAALLCVCLLILTGAIVWTRWNHGQQAKAKAEAEKAAALALPAPVASAPLPEPSASQAVQAAPAPAIVAAAPADNSPKPALASNRQPVSTSKPANSEAAPAPSAPSSSSLAENDAGTSKTGSGQTGFILIKSSPPFATLTVNGKPAGETPMGGFMEVPVGKCHIEIVHRLTPPFDTTLTITPGFRQELKFKLDQ